MSRNIFFIFKFHDVYTTNNCRIIVYNIRTIYCPKLASYIMHLSLEFMKTLFHDTSFVNANDLIAAYGSSIIGVINRFYWREKREEERSQEAICQQVSGFKLTGAR